MRVHPKEPGRAVEADGSKVPEQGMGGLTGVTLWATDCVADADDFPTVGDTAG